MEPSRFHASSQINGSSGFTLLELIIVLVLISFIGAGVLSLGGTAARMFMASENMTVTLPQVTAALNTVNALVRHASAVTKAKDGLSMSVAIPSSGKSRTVTVAYNKAQKSLMLNEKALLNGVESVTITAVPVNEGFTDAQRVTLTCTVNLTGSDAPADFSFQVITAANNKDHLL